MREFRVLHATHVLWAKVNLACSKLRDRGGTAKKKALAENSKKRGERTLSPVPARYSFVPQYQAKVNSAHLLLIPYLVHSTTGKAPNFTKLKQTSGARKESLHYFFWGAHNPLSHLPPPLYGPRLMINFLKVIDNYLLTSRNYITSCFAIIIYNDVAIVTNRDPLL